MSLEELKSIPPDTVKDALKELTKEVGADDNIFNAFESPEECFEYLLEFYTPDKIIQHVINKNKMKAGLSKKRRSKKRRSKKRRSKKWRSKKRRSKKKRSRKF
jgi:hypothetical protein